MDIESIYNECSEIKLKEQLPTKELSVNAIKSVQSKFGENYLCYNKKHKRLFYANSQLRAYIKTMVDGLKCEKGYYYRDNDLSDILRIRIESIDVNRVNLTFVKNNAGRKNMKVTCNNEVLPLSDDEKTVRVTRKDVLKRIVDEIITDGLVADKCIS